MNQAQMTLQQERIRQSRRKTFGPAYDPDLDGERLANQHEAIRDYMLARKWRTLAEIEERLHYPQASISAQLRHLRKPEFGSYILTKRRRSGGTWEYRIERRI